MRPDSAAASCLSLLYAQGACGQGRIFLTCYGLSDLYRIGLFLYDQLKPGLKYLLVAISQIQEMYSSLTTGTAISRISVHCPNGHIFRRHLDPGFNGGGMEKFCTEYQGVSLGGVQPKPLYLGMSDEF